MLVVEPVSEPAAVTPADLEVHDHEDATARAETDPDALHRAAGLFRAAGDTERLRLLAELAHGERCVTELAQLTDAGMSTVSQRLKVLRAEGLVARRRDGKHLHYRLADSHVADLIASAIDHAGELSHSPTRKDVS